MDDHQKLQSTITALGNLRNVLDLAFTEAMGVERVGMDAAGQRDMNNLESLLLAGRAYTDRALAEAEGRA